MTAKKSKTAAMAKALPAPAAGYKNTAINIAVPPGTTDADFAAAVARTLSQPETSAASVIENWQKDTHDVNALAAELGRQIEAVNSGNLRRAEGMLIAQAHTLDNIFANLARRATGQQYLPQWEAYMRMAMRAQNQCRMTLETLASIKNPPVVFARQANIVHGGPQQVVNNGLTAGPACAHSAQPRAHAANPESGKTELLEAGDGERLDTGTAGAAGRDDPHLAPVGEIDRAANTRGQSKDRQQR